MKSLFLSLLMVDLVLRSGFAWAAASSEIMKDPERTISVELQGEITPWAASRTGGGLGLRYGMGLLSPDIRVHYVQGDYRALFARLGDSQAGSNRSSEYDQQLIANGEMKGFLIEPGLRVRGSLFREPSRWQQTARVGVIYGNLRDQFHSSNIQIFALSAEFGMPYRMNPTGKWYLVPYLGYEYGFAHRVPEAAGEMSQSRKLYYLSYRGGLGLEWVF